MTGFLMGAVSAAVLATLTYFGLQLGTVAMTQRFDSPNLHIEDYQLPD